jgi:hypothetical protein
MKGQAGHRDIIKVVEITKFIAFSRNQQAIILSIAIHDTQWYSGTKNF